ncbi:hypothetical protein [Ralstonia pseudosolanacearum]|uniref:hypothetical protein n=2 Tax=Ralstonia pseudosolanacearum TaxID=1310165 RepID=UPI002676B1AB|nr:hypothetical protein [Ralstonia pseudosolanacearum]MDO3564088.1 hypothetical protein [Ralstonia pseudosolanacearum]MDO3573820.1 hypothetical protein [Ralstonia pseudosolanacearum]MDO3615893.1 hypothetical protein [Ralstonia pseudosolanacearum]
MRLDMVQMISANGGTVERWNGTQTQLNVLSCTTLLNNHARIVYGRDGICAASKIIDHNRDHIHQSRTSENKNQVFARIHSQAAHAAWIDGPALSVSTAGPRSFGTFRPARHAKCMPDQTAPPRATPSPHVVS